MLSYTQLTSTVTVTANVKVGRAIHVHVHVGAHTPLKLHHHFVTGMHTLGHLTV